MDVLQNLGLTLGLVPSLATAKPQSYATTSTACARAESLASTRVKESTNTLTVIHSHAHTYTHPYTTQANKTASKLQTIGQTFLR